MSDTCPACKSSLDFTPRPDGLASFEICPHCGIQFGYSDEAGGSLDKRSKLHRLWHDAWVANNKRPLSKEQELQVIVSALSN
jgi:hypothetical protein